MRYPKKIYGWLLNLYPARFREEYGSPMEREFLDEYREAGNRRQRVLLWLRAVADVAMSAPAQTFSELKQDLKQGIRAYRTRSLSVGLAVIAMALAIGICTGTFSVVNALLLRRLPFHHPQQLVELWMPPVGPMNGRAAFQAWLGGNPYLQGAAAFSASEMNLIGNREAFRVKVAETSANFFSLLGANPVVGRSFAPDEEILGHNAVAVISYGLWQQFFGGDPGVLNKSININGHRLDIRGVAPASFDYPGKTSIWIPTVFDFEKIPKRGAFLIQTIGRLKGGVTLQRAQKIFDAEVRRAHPELLRTVSTDEQNRPHLATLQTRLAGPLRDASWALSAMTLLVLLTACANVAQLLLSRAIERRHELAVRTALGASRARLLQQLVTEATLLTTAGAALGLIVAYWTARLASSVAPAQLAVQQYTIWDWRVLGFTVALAIISGLVFGILPAWLVGRSQRSAYFVRNQPGTQDRGTRRARGVLIALQAALTLGLVTSSLTLGRTFLQLVQADLGFRPAHVVTLHVSLQGTRHAGRGEWGYYSEALHRLRAAPGVDAAGAVSYLPLANSIYMADAMKLDSGQSVQGVVMNAVTPGYFRAMGIGFLAGSDFAERQGSERAVIVNQAFVQEARLGETILGRNVTASWSRRPYRIAGVVRATRFAGPAYASQPEIYWPVQEEPPQALTFVARVQGAPEAFLARSRDVLKAVDPEVPVYDVKTLDQRLADVLARPKFYTTATFVLAALSILLAAAGIYGTTAYALAQRRHEMGVRMAVGASRARIRSMLLRESLVPILYGGTAGVVLSALSGQYLSHLLESAAQQPFWALMAAAAILLFTGLAAAWSGTAGVLSIDPAEALRAE